MEVLFIDDRLHEVMSLWRRSGCGASYVLLPLVPFTDIDAVLQLVDELHPDVICIGHGLGSEAANGADVVRALQEAGYAGHLVANSGGGLGNFRQNGANIEFTIDRNPQQLAELLTRLSTIV